MQALAAGQVLFALGDSNHPLKITEKGKDALMVFATDTRCSYANIVVRKELWDKGVKTVEALAEQKLVGRKAVVAATAIGSGTYVYGVYVLQNVKGGDGKPVNDQAAGLRGETADGAGVAAGGGGGRLRQADLRHPGREGVEPGLRRAHPGHGGLRAEGNHREVARSRAGLCQRLPYMETFKREVVLESVRYYRTIFDWDFVIEERDYERGMKVWVPTAVDKRIPYKQAVDMSFVKKAQAKYK